MLAASHHGKSKVRVARVWRHPNGMHDFVEFIVHTTLEAEMSQNQRWFVQGDNKDMTATDTQKNTVCISGPLYLSGSCPRSSQVISFVTALWASCRSTTLRNNSIGLAHLRNLHLR
jgi:hypothetical protein